MPLYNPIQNSDFIEEGVTNKYYTDERADARITKQSIPTAIQNLNYIFDIDVEEAVSHKAIAPLAIPTYVTADADQETTHPSILYFPQGWNGYKFWLGHTPYTGASYIYENPSIVCSNDGFTWVTPAGLTNPIEPQPLDGGFNSDINLVADHDGKTIHMVWRYSGGGNVIYYARSSVDGVNWLNKRAILTTVSTVSNNLSPAILWDGDKYIMWTIDIVPTNYVLKMRTCATIDGTYSAPSDCVLTAPSGKDLWHIDIKKVGNQYHMLIMVCEALASGANGSLYFAKSNDGVNWTISTRPLLDLGGNGWDLRMYKSTMIPMMNGREFKYAIWYASSYPKFKVGYSEISFNRSKLWQQNISDIMSAKSALYPWVFCDTFGRADAETLANAETGQAWTSTAGTFKVVSGQAAATLAENTISTADIGISDYFLSATMAALGTSAFIHFRHSNSTNYWSAGYSNSGTTFMIGKTVAGTATTYYSGALAVNDVISIECRGPNIKVFVNGVLRVELTDVFNQTATLIALRTATLATRFDNIVARRLY